MTEMNGQVVYEVKCSSLIKDGVVLYIIYTLF